VIPQGGPADLNLETLIKRRQPATEVTIFMQNLADATFGFGVAFSDRALGFLGDNASIRAVPMLAPAGMESSVTSAAHRRLPRSVHAGYCRRVSTLRACA